MKRNFYSYLAAFIMVMCFARIGLAITVTATPTPNTLTANMAINYSGFCGSMTVNFGDGLQAFPTICPPAAPTCSLNVVHTYAAVGTYTISALCTSLGVNPPNPGTTTVSVGQLMNIVSPPILPAGTLSAAYNFQLQTTGGQLPLKYSLFSGTLPPGLSLSNSGQFSGTPTALGTYSFLVQVTDLNNQTTQKIFSLTINLPSISGPTSLTTSVTRGIFNTRTVSYQLTASSPVTLPLISNAGVFSLRGTILETINQPLTVFLLNGRGQASETITVSPGLIEQVLSQGSNSFVFQRSFSLGGSPVLTTTVTLNITTEGAAPFDIKSIQLYFENRQIEVSVDRNFPKLKAYADIHLLGSGLLQGFWTVDNQILSNVTQHITSGQIITLQTPDIPPLPTFELGTHLVRFVLTNPVTKVPLPTIIYYVNPSESQVALVKIALVSPGRNSIHPSGPLTFKWEGMSLIPLYLIEFFNDEKGITPVFSAFIKEPLYTLPDKGFSQFFEKGSNYYWKVTGLNKTKNQVGESERWSFSFEK
jgi:hypothetical protein